MFTDFARTYFSTCRRSFEYSALLSGSDVANSLSSQLNWKAVIKGSAELRAIKLGLARALYSEILVDDSLNGSPTCLEVPIICVSSIAMSSSYIVSNLITNINR